MNKAEKDFIFNFSSKYTCKEMSLILNVHYRKIYNFLHHYKLDFQKERERYSSKLSKTELEVLKYFALSTNNMSKLLFKSNCTIKTHCNNIFQKLGAHSKAEAILIAMKKNLLELNDFITESEIN